MKTRSPRPLLVALVVLVCMPFAPRTVQAQGIPSLLSDQELPGNLVPEQWRRMEDLIRRPVPDINIFRIRPTQEFEPMLQENGPGFALNFLDLKLEKLELELGKSGGILVKFNRGEGRFTVGEDGLYGHVIANGSFYAVAGLGGGKAVVEEVPFETNLEPSFDASEFGPSPPPETNPHCSADTELSILVLASSKVAKDEKKVAEKAKVEILSIDNALQNSGVARTVKLAGTGIIDFESTDSLVADVRRFSEMENVKELRRQHGADLVFLITDHDEGAAARQILSGRDGAFALISYENLNHPRFSFAHEFGHLLGAGHEAVQEAMHPDLHYASAFVPSDDATEWCDLMAVAVHCKSRQLIYSNPGQWLGVKVGQDENSINNARALREHFAYAAKFNCVP